MWLLHVAVGRLLGRVDLVGVVHSVLVALAGLGCIQASLCRSELAMRKSRERRATVCSAYLDQILALSLGDQRLELGRCESVDQAGLRHNEQ